MRPSGAFTWVCERLAAGVSLLTVKGKERQGDWRGSGAGEREGRGLISGPRPGVGRNTEMRSWGGGGGML